MRKTDLYWIKVPASPGSKSLSYLKCTNFREEKFSRILPKFAKLNPREMQKLSFILDPFDFCLIRI